jgi:flagellar hook-associated protein 3 FlgL
MNMRVTVGGTMYTSIRTLQNSSSKLASIQEKMTSDRQIMRPSDNPSATAAALRIRSELSRAGQFAGNASSALGWLGAADTAFSTANSILQKVRTLTVQGLNSGANAPGANTALADQVDSLRQSLLSTANSSYLGRPLFGGSSVAGTVAYAPDPTGQYTYTTAPGAATAVQLPVSETATVPVSTVGSAAFGDAATSVFAVLANLSGALRSGNVAGMNTGLAAVDSSMSQISAAQAVEGATYSQVQGLRSAGIGVVTSLKSQLADLEEPDLAEMAIEVTSANTAFQAALATTAKITQTSLLDFLR